MADLSPEGARLAAARAELAEAMAAVRDAVRKDVAAGMSEVEASKTHGVARMTVRTWLGK